MSTFKLDNRHRLAFPPIGTPSLGPVSAESTVEMQTVGHRKKTHPSPTLLRTPTAPSMPALLSSSSSSGFFFSPTSPSATQSCHNPPHHHCMHSATHRHTQFCHLFPAFVTTLTPLLENKLWLFMLEAYLHRQHQHLGQSFDTFRDLKRLSERVSSL